ncbi:hypothetical protein LTR78_006963 [Recurvomyces mirabilis]|uniref:Ribosomal RNA-processing protein 43 n=1 Tax=Recurvomyces mirabilis TaxID=574656 RepID=A0AAE0WJZ8_9PEZI|nr:hypothetical protein LTR78_006963 [Recurvomyces mirabilis]KAK5153347.1 hypothetical protein LTS14_007516 [Recurvomyces mirabilis]
MANGAAALPGLAFPKETFAKLTPAPFLQAHLQQAQSIRPNGRALEESRDPVINTGSLSHCNGSAVARLGDTAIVCGVRAELLLASSVASPPNEDTTEDEAIEELGLLVPNCELSTGCSPDHLPGSPPGSLAQSLSYRISSLLYSSRLIQPSDLYVEYVLPRTGDDIPDQGPATVIKAYWTLYIDILCIALDGNAFDAAWTAVIAALKNCKLPKAWWDQDREMVLCSPVAKDAHGLSLRSVPVPTTFALFSTLSPLKQRSIAEYWLLADPDNFEEGLCTEIITLTLSKKRGGGMIGKTALAQILDLSKERTTRWRAALKLG